MESFKKSESHPSYGMLGFSRVSGGLTSLFGSSIQHKSTMRLRLMSGEVQRGLNTDWYHGRKLLYEVEMSQTQFADLISNPNCGDGIPVTIRYCNGEHIDPPDFVDKKDQHVQEFHENLSGTYEETRKLISDIKAIFSAKRTMTKAEQENVLSALDHVAQNIGTNMDYAMRAFNEQVDKTVSEAKGEVEAFVQNKLLQIANMKLVEERESLLDDVQQNTSVLMEKHEEKDSSAN